MNLDPLSKRIREKIGIPGQARMTVLRCNELIAALDRVYVERVGIAADVAQAIAGIELMCALLRPVIGHEHVDIETAEQLQTLQGWIADLEEEPEGRML
ncbi:hypothetical protein AB3X91_03645 [Paraburkholderia sp. BR14263]|uniref:hypothetical protein n=1 Tax=unclassified Paraburkholderia TaxID=2615204 RepID=UPI0034CE2C09